MTSIKHTLYLQPCGLIWITTEYGEPLFYESNHGNVQKNEKFPFIWNILFMERTFQIVFIRILYANWKRISLIHCKKNVQITLDFVESFTRMVTWYVSLKILPWICSWPTNHRTGSRIRCSDRSVNFKSRDKPDIFLPRIKANPLAPLWKQ